MPNRSAASGNPERAISRTVFRVFRSSLCEPRCCLTRVTGMRVSPASLCASFVDGGNSGSPFYSAFRLPQMATCSHRQKEHLPWRMILHVPLKPLLDKAFPEWEH